MDKIIAVLILLTNMSFLLVSSSSLQFKPTIREEQLQQFVKLTLPFLKQNFMNQRDLDSLYKILVSDTREKTDSNEVKKSSKVEEAFESVKRKLDDYGHLRFGRNGHNSKSTSEQNSQWSGRVKYNDPDYGHMRFG